MKPAMPDYRRHEQPLSVDVSLKKTRKGFTSTSAYLEALCLENVAGFMFHIAGFMVETFAVAKMSSICANRGQLP